MKRWLRKILLDDRKFKRIKFALGTLVFVTSVLIVVLAKTINYEVKQGHLSMMGESGVRTIEAMSDETNSIIGHHIDVLNGLDGELANPQILRSKLDTLLSLPGVICAVCLVGGNRLEIDPEKSELNWLADSLKKLRQEFFRMTKPDIMHCMIARAMFQTYRYGQDTIYLVADIYDSNGHRIVKANKIKPKNPEATQYLFALVIDKKWIKSAVVEHFNKVIFEKDVFLLLTFPEKYGLGVLSGRDTVWWYGLRKLTGKGKLGKIQDWDWTSNWFCYRMIFESQVDSEIHDYELRQAHGNRVTFFFNYYLPKLFKLTPYFISFLLFCSGIILLFSLTQLRKQWLSRQIALEQIAHSIKTPVARLRLNADTLLENRVVSPETERELVQAIGRECGRLDRAVQNAALAIQEGSLQLHKSQCELGELCKELVDDWKPVFTQNKIKLELVTNEIVIGEYDRDLLAILFDNLIDNALRHSRLNHGVVESGDSVVTILMSKNTGLNMIKVTDSGTGVDVKDRKRIFERFDRGSDRALTGTTGLGLGLALSKEIVVAHGGTISVENAPSGGACFKVMLPST